MSVETLKNRPKTIVFAKCPSCEQLIKMKSFTDAVMEGARNCPFCQVFIEKKEIVSSCQKYLIKTKSFNNSQEIFNIHWAFWIILGEILLAIALSYSSDVEKEKSLIILIILGSFLLFFWGFMMTLNWLSRFDNLQTTDEDFTEIRKKVRRSQVIWAWANIINLIWWAVYIKFF